jgi:hypothetical protein
VNLWYTSGDPESLFLAIQLGEIFKKANWTVLAASANMPGIVWGFAIPDSPSADTGKLRTAFHASGLEYGTEVLPVTAWMGVSPDKTKAVLMVGSRKPAIFP